jgi:hypothetical protein
MMAAGLRATAKAVDYPPEPKIGAPVLAPTEASLFGLGHSRRIAYPAGKN